MYMNWDQQNALVGEEYVEASYYRYSNGAVKSKTRGKPFSQDRDHVWQESHTLLVDNVIKVITL